MTTNLLHPHGTEISKPETDPAPQSEAIQPGPGEFESQQGYHSAWNQREIMALKAKIARKNRRG